MSERVRITFDFAHGDTVAWQGRRCCVDAQRYTRPDLLPPVIEYLLSDAATGELLGWVKDAELRAWPREEGAS